MTTAPSTVPRLAPRAIDTAVLTKALADLCKVVPTRPPVPCLGGAVLETGAAGTTLAAFDYSTSVVITVDRTPQPTSRSLVPPAQIRALLKHHAPTTSLLRIKDGEWHLDQGALTASGALMTVEDYPKLPPARAPWVFEIDADILGRVARRAVTSACKEADNLPILECAHISLDGHQVKLASTNRYQLGVSTVPVKRNARVRLLKDWGSAKIVARDLLTVANLLTGTVRVSWDHERLILRTDDVVATLRQQDGEFPTYERLFPSEFCATASLDKAELVKAAKYVSEALVRNEPIHLALSAASLTLDAGDSVKAKAEVNVGRFVGEPTAIGFNPKFLMEGLSLLGDRVSLSLQSPSRPAVLTTEGDDDFRFLLMPVRING